MAKTLPQATVTHWHLMECWLNFVIINSVTHDQSTRWLSGHKRSPLHPGGGREGSGSMVNVAQHCSLIHNSPCKLLSRLLLSGLFPFHHSGVSHQQPCLLQCVAMVTRKCKQCTTDTQPNCTCLTCVQCVCVYGCGWGVLEGYRGLYVQCVGGGNISTGRRKYEAELTYLWSLHPSQLPSHQTDPVAL